MFKTALLAVVGISAPVLITWAFLTTSATAHPQPNFTQHAFGHMSVSNRLGDKDFQCLTPDCNPFSGMVGTRTGLRYDSTRDAIMGIPDIARR